jgi:tRNA-specific 2-thiouridylase
MIEENKRVLLGMSGGTDSSVAAMRLLEAGYEVTGVTFRFYELNDSTEYLEDARNLAERLGIRHITYDAREIFNEQIIEYFVHEYMAGHTPVPCTLCNNYLKWPLLAKIADEMGIFYIATGHYVQKIKLADTYYITHAVDPDKDQSFFLWGLKQDILSRILLPMGEITKVEARAWAAERGFQKVATKKDSIGVCFCPMDYRSFLKNWLVRNGQTLVRNGQPWSEIVRRGRFVDEKGDFIAWHEGYPFYTIGQRRGLGIHLNRPVS